MRRRLICSVVAPATLPCGSGTGRLPRRHTGDLNTPMDAASLQLTTHLHQLDVGRGGVRLLSREDAQPWGSNNPSHDTFNHGPIIAGAGIIYHDLVNVPSAAVLDRRGQGSALSRSKNVRQCQVCKASQGDPRQDPSAVQEIKGSIIDSAPVAVPNFQNYAEQKQEQ
ncbi:uncharacterized protein LOC125519139 isoform X3 [Triticum urartu]|uniref:uncharacterized protein LOC125519139 isoform X3 n=1 Tax=Triticum urartu TaxID=4572 RepID=UPI002043160B|nr:uncharacterized protein LOC125519139 isoform X3 [Triticum urartu]